MLEDMKEYVNKLNLNNKVLFAGRIDFNNLFEIIDTMPMRKREMKSDPRNCS